MELLECKACNYFTDVRCNFNRHLKSSKHNKKMRVQNLPTVITDELTCKKCEKVFKSDESMRKHINYRCKETKDNPELRYTTLKLKQAEKELNQEKKNKEKLVEKHIELLEKHVEMLSQHSNHTTNNTTNNTVNIQNITLLAYKDTDTSHLTPKDYMHCIKEPHGMTHLIEKIHFNPMKPENRNISMSNLKDKYMMMYDGEQWLIVHKDKIGDIYAHKEILMSQWVEEHPELKDKFCRYIQDVDQDIRSRAEEDIKLMIYNKSV